MKLDKYNELKLKLEVFKFEKNYITLNKVLYYFSFLGNVFLIYFGYFFVKSITNSIPQLFPYQDVFFAIFIGLFLTGYELTKRFALEQLSIGLFQVKKLTTSLLVGALACLLLVAGSFYLSIKGAHRLVDNSQTIVAALDSTTQKKADSIARYYDKEIIYYRTQTARTKLDRLYRDSIVTQLQTQKEFKIKETENRTQVRAQSDVARTEENSTAFLFITIFLEFIILLGVGFNAFYTLGSFEETKKLLQTPKFKQLELNLKLLKLYYQNGKKIVGDQTLSFNKFQSLVQNQKIDSSQKDLKSFIVLCQELDIIKEFRGRKKQFMIPYQEAKDLLENQEVI
jgi:hypothetical protein